LKKDVLDKADEEPAYSGCNAKVKDAKLELKGKSFIRFLYLKVMNVTMLETRFVTKEEFIKFFKYTL
jgi:hypothetical protein